MSHDLQLLLADTREQIATSRRLRGEHKAKVREHIAKNIELGARSIEAMMKSRALLAKNRD